MIGRKFTDLRNGKVVEVTDRFEDIAILDGSKKIKVNQLLNTDHFDEYIDPKNFFRNESLLNNFAQKIKQIPDDVIKNIKEESLVTENSNSTDNTKTKKIKMKDPMAPLIDEPAVLPADPEMERLELMKKYGINQDPILDAQRQLEKFKSLLQEPEEEIQTFEVERDEDEIDFEEDLEENYQNEVVKEVDAKTKPVRQEIKSKSEKIDDPIIAMFKNVKRNRDFKVSFDYQNMIPRADFIEMMEDSYNTSIIEFLADEFTNQILENPNLIKDKIREEIKKVVYNKKEVINENKNEQSAEKKEVILETKIETKFVEKPKRGRRKKEELENDRSAVN